MKITVNNKPMTVPDHTSLSGVLILAGIDPANTATGLNGNEVKLVDRDSTILKDGDEVQVIEPFYRQE